MKASGIGCILEITKPGHGRTRRLQIYDFSCPAPLEVCSFRMRRASATLRAQSFLLGRQVFNHTKVVERFSRRGVSMRFSGVRLSKPSTGFLFLTLLLSCVRAAGQATPYYQPHFPPDE